jgi:hypothetical protein
MYIAGTEGRQVLVIDRNRMKLAHQLTAANMLYPHGIAFSKSLREVYVTGLLSADQEMGRSYTHGFNRGLESLTDKSVAKVYNGTNSS